MIGRKEARKARVWLFSRNLAMPMNGLAATVSSTFKHWAVMVEYLDENDEMDMMEIYQAGNDDGFVVASHRVMKRSGWPYQEEKKRNWERDT